jgi:uncharacterized protein (DUF2336 family)
MERSVTEHSLSQQDVIKLLSDPSPEYRAVTAEKIAKQFSGLGANERKLAEEIFRLMVKDAELRVREALAANLKESPDVPHDIAIALARDVDSVSLPILQFSDVLTDEDLVEIVSSQSESKQTVIAKRTNVSSSVSTALVNSGSEKVVETLVGNTGADINEKSLQKVIDKFGAVEAMQEKLVHRNKLPITVSERLVTMVSEKMQQHILANHELRPEIAAGLIVQSRERATIGLSTSSDEGEIEKLVRQLHKYGRLTPSIILRAICMGDILFFEAGLAQLTGLPLVNVRMLIHDSGNLGFKSLYEKAGLPGPFFPAMRAAIDVSTETKLDGEANDRERHSRRMIERILTQYGDLGVTFENDDLEYLLTKMNQLPPTLHSGKQ